MKDVERVEETIPSIYWDCGVPCHIKHTQRATAERCPARKSVIGLQRLKAKVKALEAFLEQLKEEGSNTILIQEELDHSIYLLKRRYGYAGE